MTYYQIDGKIYYLNMDRIFQLIGEIPQKEKVVNTTITQYYGRDEDPNANNGKEIVEAKSNTNETMSNVRYDFLKFIIYYLLSNKFENEGIPISIKHLNEMSFGQGLCLNTLIEYKILLEVETDGQK